MTLLAVRAESDEDEDEDDEKEMELRRPKKVKNAPRKVGDLPGKKKPK
jgi:hypothetical protein